jgi:hypothetical protein
MELRRFVTTLNIIKNISFINNEVVLTDPIPLRLYAKRGFFSVEYNITANTFKLEYLICSIIDGVYIEPAAATDIGTRLTGHGFLSFNPIIAPFMKIKATCTGGGDLNLYLNIQ